MATKYYFEPKLDIEKKDRNFFINIDGTWNDPSDVDEKGSGTTNVLRFHKAIMRQNGQYSRYFPGVGNQEQNGTFGQIIGGVFGGGADQLCDEAYVVLVTNYRPGDKIFITGFSRGAAVARLLANLIKNKGIPEAIEYSKDKNGRITKFKAIGKKKQGVDIEMLGCWDTVASFGIPVNIFGINFQKINLFKDFTVAKNVKKAYHLVSVDENRNAFEPTLMNKESRIHEVWFPGVHADVGGGYDRRLLADTTLKYMINIAETKHSVVFHQDSLDEIQENLEGNGVMHEHSERPFDFKMGSREIGVLVDDKMSKTEKPKIHTSVVTRIKSREDEYKPENFVALRDRMEIVK